MKLELVGMGQQPLGRDGEVEGWRITYLPEGAEAPDFVHHVMPAAIFANYAEEFGLDVDNPVDFDEVLDIVLYEVFGGDENPMDSIEPLRAARNGQDKKNATGRRMRRRADRAKQDVEITGIEGVRERLREERHTGRAQRVERMQTAQRAREGRKPVTEAAPVPQPGRIA